MKKHFLIITLLLFAIAYCFLVPKPKYKSPDIIPQLNIPSRFSIWYSKDVSQELNANDARYNFISDVFARAYRNNYGEQLLFLILDAGNFHHPKVCMGSSGFKIKELNDIEFSLPDKTFKAHSLYAGKETDGTLIIYWICINGKMVNWAEQKTKQLWFSLFNKEKTGLMIRLDIPTEEEKIEDSIKTAREFIKDLSQELTPVQAEYIFGNKSAK